MIGQNIAHYRITAKLGEGGMGVVYRASDTKLHRDVALKLLPEELTADPSRRTRFQREAQLLAALNHPNIAAVYGIEDNAIVMELVEGPTLADRIAAGPIPPDEALAIARQIADAIEAAHEKGIIHRDLKPANIKLTPDGQVKVLDFGLAKALDETPAQDSNPANSPTLVAGRSLPGLILGTASYMSPEQARGGHVDKRTDIWAFGVVLYEMLTAKRLFEGETISDMLAQVLTKEPDLTVVPAHLRPILERCLQRDRKQRLRDIGDIAFLEPVAPPPAQPSASARAPWIIAAIASAIAVGAVAYSLASRSSPAGESNVFLIEHPNPVDIVPILSPDGRLVALSPVRGQSSIQIRPLDSTELRTLADTAGARHAFWARQGRLLCFFLQQRLHCSQPNGENRITVADAPDAEGASWTPHGGEKGTILFSSRGALFAVAASGGPVRAVPLGSNAGIARFPHLLPDGRHFLYYRPSDSEGNAIYLASLDSSVTPRRIVNAPSAGQVFSAGSINYLVFTRNNRMWATPWNSKALTVTGEPFPLLDDVAHYLTGLNGFSFSSQPLSLSYRRNAFVPQAELVWFDRKGNKLERLGEPDRYFRVRFDPSGTTVLLTAGLLGSAPVYWQQPIDGRRRTLLFQPEINARVPLWSRDGNRIAFVTKGSDGAGIDSISPDNPQTRETLFPPSSGWNSLWLSDWSPDGREILVESFEANRDVYFLDVHARDGKLIPFLTGDEYEGESAFCPLAECQSWVAYSSAGQVFVRNRNPGKGTYQISSHRGRVPIWRADGRELYYYDDDKRTVMAVPVVASNSFQAGKPEPLFSLPASTFAPARPFDVTRDGQRFLVISPTEDSTPRVVVHTHWKPEAIKE